ncbi:MAG: hypothetical protein KIT62_03285 [Cyclobacteriaceae bacterium]|nr:hypothetical protein [Cyclobacteriaceae bacterium]
MKTPHSHKNRTKEEAFLDIINGLQVVHDRDKYLCSIFLFKGDRWYFEIAENTLWVRIGHVWSGFEAEFGLKPEETKTCIMDLVNVHFERQKFTTENLIVKPVLMADADFFNAGTLTYFMPSVRYQPTTVDFHFNMRGLAPACTEQKERTKEDAFFDIINGLQVVYNRIKRHSLFFFKDSNLYFEIEKDTLWVSSLYVCSVLEAGFGLKPDEVMEFIADRMQTHFNISGLALMAADASRETGELVAPKNRTKEEAFQSIINGLVIRHDRILYPNSIFFFKNNRWCFEIEKSSLWVEARNVWSVFEKEFGRGNAYKVGEFITGMLATHFKMHKLRPVKGGHGIVGQVNEHFKTHALTPAAALAEKQKQWTKEEVFFNIINGLVIVHDKAKYPHSIFLFKDDRWYFEITGNTLRVNAHHVWSAFETKFGLMPDEVTALIAHGMKTHLCMSGLEPVSASENENPEVDEHFKMHGLAYFYSELPALKKKKPNRTKEEAFLNIIQRLKIVHKAGLPGIMILSNCDHRYFEIEGKGNRMWVDKDVWSGLEDGFGLTKDETEKFIAYMMEAHLKISGLRPVNLYDQAFWDELDQYL